MNRINFTAKDNFPLSSDTTALLQQIITTNAGLALLGGSDYILSGCLEDGNNVSAGIVVIGGEILPFQAGAKQSKITVEETTQDLTALGADYPEAYVFRVAKFSATGEYNWSDFSQILTNRELQARFESVQTEPVGTIKMWPGVVAPDGYLLCQGQTLVVADYPELAAVLLPAYPAPAGLFLLPNLAGKFIVGYDVNDSDYNAIKKTGGEKTHLLTESEMPAHSHNVQLYAGTTGDITQNHVSASVSTDSGNKTSVTGGGQPHENRPPYHTLAYIIKAR
jgi:microcystin-dependent protein